VGVTGTSHGWCDSSASTCTGDKTPQYVQPRGRALCDGPISGGLAVRSGYEYGYQTCRLRQV